MYRGQGTQMRSLSFLLKLMSILAMQSNHFIATLDNDCEFEMFQQMLVAGTIEIRGLRNSPTNHRVQKLVELEKERKGKGTKPKCICILD